jgi:hypothetical protein
MLWTLGPCLESSKQHIEVIGMADKIRFIKDYPPINASQDELLKQWVYREYEDGRTDSIKFIYLIRQGASSDEKNFALAFQRAWQFKQKLPDADITFRIPIIKDVKARIYHDDDISGTYRGVNITMEFKLKDYQ